MSEEIDKIKEKTNVENFIFNDEVQNLLEQINNNVMEFNILEITGMGTQEIKHSNLLSWMFGDNEHNLEYKIFEGFLKKVIKNNKNNKNMEQLRHYVYLSKIQKALTIYREKNNIDLLLVDEANKVVIAIENKVYADERYGGEDDGQLEKYKNIVTRNYKELDKFFIYLTIDNSPPSKENQDEWLIASHQMVGEVVEDILKTNNISNKTDLMLSSYLDLLKRRNIMEDKELKELCEKIWQNPNYKDALQILNNYQPGVVEFLNFLRGKLLDKSIGITDNLERSKSDFTVFTENYKKIYPKWEDFKKPKDVILDIRFGFYIVKSNIQFWLVLENENEESKKYFDKIKEKLSNSDNIEKDLKSKKSIVIYAENLIENFKTYDIESHKESLVEKFIEILNQVDECFSNQGE